MLYSFLPASIDSTLVPVKGYSSSTILSTVFTFCKAFSVPFLIIVILHKVCVHNVETDRLMAKWVYLPLVDHYQRGRKRSTFVFTLDVESQIVKTQGHENKAVPNYGRTSTCLSFAVPCRNKQTNKQKRNKKRKNENQRRGEEITVDETNCTKGEGALSVCKDPGLSLSLLNSGACASRTPQKKDCSRSKRCVCCRVRTCAGNPIQLAAILLNHSDKVTSILIG